MTKESVRDHFEAIAGEDDRWKERSSYYYELLDPLPNRLAAGRRRANPFCLTQITILSRREERDPVTPALRS